MQVRLDNKSQVGSLSSLDRNAAAKPQKEFAVSPQQQKAVGAGAKVTELSAELKALALRLQSGELDYKDATEAFVDVVAKRRNDPKEFQEHVKAAQKTVTEFLEQDPNFFLQLSEQLKRMAKTS